MNVLREINNQRVQVVRKWPRLNTHRGYYFFRAEDRGRSWGPKCRMGVCCYKAYPPPKHAQLWQWSSLGAGPASLLPELRKRKVPLATDQEENFLGFRRKASGKPDTHAAGFEVSSGWRNLNDMCTSTGVKLKWTTTDSRSPSESNLVVSDAVITDRTLYYCGGSCHPQWKSYPTSRRTRLSRRQAETLCWSLCQIHSQCTKHAALGGDILIFAIQSRMQVLPLRFNLSTWYPETHSPNSIMHSEASVHMENIAHITKCCKI